jgi:hypothetical protein
MGKMRKEPIQMNIDYAQFVDSSPFMSLKHLFQKCIENISNDESLKLINIINSILPYSLRSTNITTQSIPYNRGEDSVKISVYYNEKGKTLQEIIEQFFEEYCTNL